MCPAKGQHPQFSQLYIHDTESKRQNRHAVMPLLDPTALDQLLTMMYNINPYVEVFKMVRDMMATEGVPTDLKLRCIASRTKDARRYNVPTADEVATLIIGDGSKVVDTHHIIVTQQAGLFQPISELHVGYMASHYSLIFPYMRMDGIRIFCSMALLCKMLMQIWMKTMRKNLSIKKSIAM
jgi:hypothetical protein